MAKAKKKKAKRKAKKTQRKAKKAAKKKGPKRKAKPRHIPPPPEPGTPEIIREPLPAQGGGVPKTTYTPPEEKTARGTHHPRFAAGMYYTTDLKGATIEQIHRHPLWRDFSLSTLHRWSIEDRWVERRKSNLKKWQLAIEARIGSEVVKARMVDLDRARDINEIMFRKLKGKALKSRSFEGMVGAWVRLNEMMDSWSERLSKEFIPEAPMGMADASGMIGGHAHEARPSLSPTEARVAAKAVIAERRQQMRIKRAQEEAAADGEERPALQIVEGKL